MFISPPKQNNLKLFLALPLWLQKPTQKIHFSPAIYHLIWEHSNPQKLNFKFSLYLQTKIHLRERERINTLLCVWFVSQFLFPSVLFSFSEKERKRESYGCSFKLAVESRVRFSAQRNEEETSASDRERQWRRPRTA